MGWRTPRTLMAAAVAGIVCCTGGGAAFASSAWVTYHGDNYRSGVDGSEPSLSTVHQAWYASFDGAAVYGQPVVADGRAFFGTEADNVYAVDAHDGHLLWSHNLGTPVDVRTLGICGNIDPLGITSTPVIDQAHATVYVVGEVSVSGQVRHLLEGFNLYSGSRTVAAYVDPTLPAPETQADLEYLQQRAALTLANGRVYVSYGGLDGDCGDYHGWVVGVDPATGALQQFDTTPGGSGGAVWESGGGPAVDGAGNLYVTTGNPLGRVAGYYDDVVKVAASLPAAPLHTFHDSHANPGGDEDFGTGNTVLFGNELFAVGKSNYGYVLAQSDLHPVAVIPGVCPSNPDGGPIFDPATDSVYVPCRGAGLRQVKLSNDSLGWGPTGPQGAPILVNGQLWAVQYGSTTLDQMDATSGAVLHSYTLPAAAPTFSSPSAADGLILVGTGAGVVAFAGPSGPPPPAPPPPPPGAGYQLVAADGGVFAYGNAGFHGGLGGTRLAAPVVGAVPTPDHRGYWMVASDGGVFNFGDARFYGSLGGTHLDAPIVGMAAAAGGDGYWLVGADGGVFSFGPGAPFRGSTGGRALDAPVRTIVADPATGGYWLFALDGGVFNYDAPFFGSLGGTRLQAPITAAATPPSGGGYLMAAADGGVFALGPDAHFHGSTGGAPLIAPVTGMATDASTGGYWLGAADGGVFNFGAPFEGSAGGVRLSAPVVAIMSS